MSLFFSLSLPYIDMKAKVKMIIMSHLSDVQEGNLDDSTKWHRINFVKFLLLKHPNTDVEVNADAEYVEFQQRNPKL